MTTQTTQSTSMKTLNDILVNGQMAEDYFLNKLGYTRAKFTSTHIYPHGAFAFNFDLYDDFQDNLPDSMKYKHGYFNRLPGDKFWEKLQQWPTREQRELTILSRKAAALDADLDKITSLQVKAFVESLRPSLDELRRQISSDPNVEIS